MFKNYGPQDFIGIKKETIIKIKKNAHKYKPITCWCNSDSQKIRFYTIKNYHVKLKTIENSDHSL